MEHKISHGVRCQHCGDVALLVTDEAPRPDRVQQRHLRRLDGSETRGADALDERCPHCNVPIRQVKPEQVKPVADFSRQQFGTIHPHRYHEIMGHTSDVPEQSDAVDPEELLPQAEERAAVAALDVAKLTKLQGVEQPSSPSEEEPKSRHPLPRRRQSDDSD